MDKQTLLNARIRISERLRVLHAKLYGGVPLRPHEDFQSLQKEADLLEDEKRRITKHLKDYD